VVKSCKEKARHCLEESGFSSDVYKIVDPWQSSYQPGMEPQGKGARYQQIQLELYPGDKISNIHVVNACCLFSGSLITHERGITVAHAFREEDYIEIPLDSDAAAAYAQIVGKCRKTFQCLPRQSGGYITADLAVLELDTDKCSVGNTVWWPFRGEHTGRRIKIYKGAEIPENTEVMILDRNGQFQTGRFHSERLTDDRFDLRDVRRICAVTEEDLPANLEVSVPVTEKGDSGALVMSLPSSETDVLYVYGIVIGLYETDQGRFTVANSLWEVIKAMPPRDWNSAGSCVDTGSIDFA